MLYKRTCASHCIPNRLEQHRNTPTDFAEEMGKWGNQALSMLTDVVTSLGQNFHFQGEMEHFAQGFGIGAKPRSITAIRVSSLPYWKVGADFLCQQTAEQQLPHPGGLWVIWGMPLLRRFTGEGQRGRMLRHGTYPKTSWCSTRHFKTPQPELQLVWTSKRNCSQLQSHIAWGQSFLRHLFYS